MTGARARPSGERARADAHRGREIALQMLYQWEVGQTDVDTVARTFPEIATSGPAPTADARRFGESLARGTTAHLKDIDPLLADRAEHWRLSRMAVLDRLILRLATYELLHLDTPPAVVIDEAIELAKKFSTEESARFTNGVLDAVRRQIDATRSGPQP